MKRTPPDLPDRLLDVKEAATLLGMSVGTVYQWSYEHRLPVGKPSGLLMAEHRLAILQRDLHDAISDRDRMAFDDEVADGDSLAILVAQQIERGRA